MCSKILPAHWGLMLTYVKNVVYNKIIDDLYQHMNYINLKLNNTINHQLFCYIQHFSDMLTLNSNGLAKFLITWELMCALNT